MTLIPSRPPTGGLGRIAVIVGADFRIRFRRVSTLVVFLLISFSAYLWVPDPTTGRALLQVGGQRAVYNSAAIGMATASLGTLLIGLLAFYVVSNAIAQDVRSRCGFVIASTRMRSFEYLVGKLLGNIAFLATFVAGYMLVSMAMVPVRGEAGLEPLVFARQYLLLAPPAIVFVSMVAITFESLPLLAGRFGDVAWFFLWLGGMSAPAIALESEHPPALVRYLDFSGLGFLVSWMQETLGTTSISIGASSFDPAMAPIIVPPLTLSPEWIAPRIGACLLPLLLLPLALVFFHRFDPARVRRQAAAAGSGRFAGIQRLFKPLVRPLGALRPRSRKPATSVWNAAREDAFVTFATAPLLAATLPIFALLGLLLPLATVQNVALPVVFALLAILLSAIPTRERTDGLLAMVFAAPRLKSRFVGWKLLTSLLVATGFVAVPLVRLLLADPASAAALLVGTFFTCSAAVTLGVVSTNPKTFLALFLLFWYAVVNGGGSAPQLDFAGFYGTATPAVMASYLALAIAGLAVARTAHSARLAREGY